MEYEEAIEWLKGERSTCNTYFQRGFGSSEASLMTAQADEAMTQQAYWIVKAHKEGLIQPTETNQGGE